MRGFLAALVFAGAAAFLGTGCANDCQVACGKLEFCELLPNISLRQCVDRCQAREGNLPDETRLCADCLDQASCSTIASQTCAEPCTPVLTETENGTGGTGGNGGTEGTAGAGGAGGAGGSEG